MVLTAYIALSPVIGLSCHRRRRKLVSANLTPASRCQDHTTWPSASRAVRYRRIRVHRIPLHVRDDRERPSKRSGTGRGYTLICNFGKSEYLCKRGLTRVRAANEVFCPSGRGRLSRRSRLHRSWRRLWCPSSYGGRLACRDDVQLLLGARKIGRPAVFHALTAQVRGCLLQRKPA
jgi:hypothetical protein